MVEKKFSKEEIERMERECETVFGIEGMEFTEKEKELGRKFYAGEITGDEYRAAFLKKD